MNFNLILIIMFASVFLVFNSAFAVNTPDSAPLGPRIYAATSVHVTDCAPYGGDPNQDGICSHWKDGTFGPGLHIDFTDSSIGGVSVHYRYDLSCTPGATLATDPSGYTVCPSTNQRDIYLELDCMTGQCPQQQAVYDVVQAFNRHGILLHVEMGENPTTSSSSITDIGAHYCDVRMVTGNNDAAGASCSSTTTNYQSYPNLKQNFFGTSAEIAGNTSFCPRSDLPPGINPPNANSYNCLTAKRQVFHYAMFVNYQWGNVPSSGYSEVVGNDFLGSLGNFPNGVGTLAEQEGTIMHELGHNFGLNHGGVGDTNNCKPNYLSVMNYAFIFPENLDPNRALDYSDKALQTLDESAVTDINIGSDPYPGTSTERRIGWSGPTGSVLTGTTGVPNDWDNNSVMDNTPYRQILNNLGPSCSASTAPVALTGFFDWGFINTGSISIPEPLNFRTSTNFFQTVLPETPEKSVLDTDFAGAGNATETHSEYPASAPLPNMYAVSISIPAENNNPGSSVQIDGISYHDGEIVPLAKGSYTVQATVANGLQFSKWSQLGSISLATQTSPTTSMMVNFDGTLGLDLTVGPNQSNLFFVYAGFGGAVAFGVAISIAAALHRRR